MKKILTILLLIASLGKISAQDISGNWFGILNVPGTPLHLVFHITRTGDNYSATMDSPDQAANGLPTDMVTFIKNEVRIIASKYAIDYTGQLISDSNLIKGIFTQGQNKLPLTLSKDKYLNNISASVKQIRPQDPVNFPYKQEEVTIDNIKANVKLAGTLTVPLSTPTKIVILITGSGPQNRNEEIPQFNHRPFLVWSDWLTKQGIAVLRYDDRGIAKSTGNFKNSTSEDFAEDVESAITYIRSRPDLKNLSIGLIGHSEGGMIAPIVASRNKNVSFIVLLAGPGVPIYQLMIRQSDDQQRLNHTPENIASINHNNAVQIFSFLSKSKNIPDATLKPEIDKILTENLSKYPPEALGNTPIKEIVESESNTYLNPWFRYFISFDPSDYLSKLHIPVLAVNGTLDSQVSAIENLQAIHNDLTKAGNKHFQTVPLKDLNHLMQKATTGAVSEYITIEETIDPLALTTVSSWINSL